MSLIMAEEPAEEVSAHDIEALNLFLKFMHKTIKRWHLENVFRGTI